MSLAWEVTADDVVLVFQQHGIRADAEDILEKHFDETVCSRIEEAVLRYTDFDDQCSSALDEIETVLIELEVIKGPKCYVAP